MENANNTRVYDAEEAHYLGLNEAVLIGQLRYWNERSTNIKNGRKWTYNTYEGWQKQFPFWSTSTIRRIIKDLEDKQIIKTDSHNVKAYDKTKWYSLDEKKLQEYIENQKATAQNEQLDYSKWAVGTVQNEQTNTRDYTETTNKDFVNRVNTSYRGYDEPTFVKQFNRVAKKYLYEYRKELIENCERVLRHYFYTYQQYMNKEHPLLKDKKFAEVCEKLIEGTEVFEDLIYEVSDYEIIINKHFETEYGIEIDYNICHFATEGIIENLAYHTCY